MIWITEKRLDTGFKGDLFNPFNIIPPIPLMEVTRLNSNL